MYMEKLLQSLGIKEKGHYTSAGSYVIEIADSDQYGKYYSSMDKSDALDENEDASEITLHMSKVVFESDKFRFTLIADLDQDTYKLVGVEIEGEE